MRKLLVALLAVALLAVPAYASVQNIKISGDIDSTWLIRDQFDLGRAGSQFNQNLLITQTRLRVDADLTENVSAVVGLLNERVWGDSDTGASADVDLNLAYVELREMLYSPLTVIIGRQNFAYGNSFLIDSTGTNNVGSTGSSLVGVAQDLTKRTAQDAVRLIFDYNPLTVEVLASKIEDNNSAGGDPEHDDVDLYGVNSTYNLGDDWDSTAEVYFWARRDKSDNVVAAPVNSNLKADTIYAPGLRASTNPIKGLNVQGEIAWQLGNKSTTNSAGTARADNIPRRAMGAQAIANYAIPFEETAEYNPVATLVYTFTSGDNSGNEVGSGTGTPSPGSEDPHHTAWDPLFENQGGGTIYNSLFDLTNSHIVMASLSGNPMEDVTVTATGTWMWLHHEVNPISGGGICTGGVDCLVLRQPTGGVARALTVSSNKAVGYEVDFDFLYDYTEDVALGFTMGWFFPGELFRGENDDVAKQFLANANVKF